MKTSKLRVTGLCEGNSPVTGQFTAQRASNAENVSIWWRHHGMYSICNFSFILGADTIATDNYSMIVSLMHKFASYLCTIAPKLVPNLKPA